MPVNRSITDEEFRAMMEFHQKISDDEINEIIRLNTLVYRKDSNKNITGWELTLTTDVNDPHTLLSDFRRIVSSKMFIISSYYAVIELTKVGIPHIHAYIESTKINASRIRKLYKKRFTLSRVRNLKAYKDYLDKDKDDIILVNYLKEKKLSRVYSYNGIPQEIPKAEVPEEKAAV